MVHRSIEPGGGEGLQCLVEPCVLAAGHRRAGNRQGAERDQPGSKAHLCADQPALLECPLPVARGDEVWRGAMSVPPDLPGAGSSPIHPTITPTAATSGAGRHRTDMLSSTSTPRPLAGQPPAAAVW